MGWFGEDIMDGDPPLDIVAWSPFWPSHVTASDFGEDQELGTAVFSLRSLATK